MALAVSGTGERTFSISHLVQPCAQPRGFSSLQEKATHHVAVIPDST
jgi:hypothetical protein